jgi:hypothetical protein
MTLFEFLSDGGLSKMAYILVVSFMTIGAGVIAGVEILMGQPINQFVIDVIILGLGSGGSATLVQGMKNVTGAKATQLNTAATNVNTVATNANTAGQLPPVSNVP